MRVASSALRLEANEAMVMERRWLSPVERPFPRTLYKVLDEEPTREEAHSIAVFAICALAKSIGPLELIRQVAVAPVLASPACGN